MAKGKRQVEKKKKMKDTPGEAARKLKGLPGREGMKKRLDKGKKYY